MPTFPVHLGFFWGGGRGILSYGMREAVDSQETGWRSEDKLTLATNLELHKTFYGEMASISFGN